MTNKKSKQSRRRKKLFLAILMILFTGVLLTTSTYAWFTANRTVTVENIDVTVAAMNGLQISVDAINWKPTITNADILGAKTGEYGGATNQIPAGENSAPVSTIGAIDGNTGFMNMYAGAIETADGQYILTTEKTTESNGEGGKFVVFDLFFSTTSATPIYLTNASNVLYSEGPSGLENAARIAFVKQGNVAAGAGYAAAQALKADASVVPIIWEPNYDTHTDAAVQNAFNTYGIKTTATGATELDYVGVKAPIGAELKMPVNSNNETYFTAVNPAIQTPSAGISKNSFQAVFNLEPGITKYRIYMWIEGQDVDCENNASGGSISYNLQFSMNDAAA